jgi:hypothetical protein
MESGMNRQNASGSKSGLISTFAMLLLASALATGSVAAQTVRGTLLERDTGRPIPYALVQLLGERGDTIATALTGTNGFFVLNSKTAGAFYLSASALGFQDGRAGILDIGDGGEMSLEFRLRPRAVELEGIMVNLPAGVVREGYLVSNGFYGRLLEGSGQFITPADIEKSHALRASELLYNISRVDVIQEGGRSRITMQGTMGTCAPPIWVDGVLISRDGSDLDQIVNMLSIEALEVYRGPAEVPLQWGGTNSTGCGVIVAWTRQGRKPSGNR